MNEYFDKVQSLGYAEAIDAIETYVKANAEKLDISDFLEFMESLRRLNCK